MGKNAPPSQKYGAPLYAVAWPTQELLFVAGGGGKKSSGIKNRCNSLPRNMQVADALLDTVQCCNPLRPPPLQRPTCITAHGVFMQRGRTPVQRRSAERRAGGD